MSKFKKIPYIYINNDKKYDYSRSKEFKLH
jgi:hypothetical protein